MKKLMIAAAAAALVGGASALESANIVGYQLIQVPAVDYVLFTPTFTGIGGNLDLTSIQVCDEFGEEIDPFNSVTFQIMDETGAYTDAYGYSPALGEGWNMDMVPIAAGDVTIPVGRAFCVANAYGDVVYLKVAGQVDLVNNNLIPNQDFVLWGNSTPVSIDLTDIQIVDENGDEVDPFNSVTIQVMDETGAYTDAYGYSPALGEGWNMDMVPIAVGEIVIAPSQSFCVANGYGEAVYFKLPDPTTYTLPSAN